MADQNNGVTPNPFAAYLDPSNPVFQAPQQPLSGFTGTGGRVLNVVDNFLAGMSKGRAMRFQQQEAQNQLGQKSILDAIKNVQDSPLPDAAKQAQVSKLQAMLGQMVLHSIDDGSGKKGGKGGGGDDEHPAGHIRGALKKILGGMLGPDAQKSPIDPKELMGTLQDTYRILQDPNNSAAAIGGKLDQVLWQAYDTVSKKNIGGQPPTTAQLMQDPQFFKAYSEAIRLTGKPTPGIEAIMGAAATADKYVADPRIQATLERDRALNEQARADTELARQKTSDLQKKAAGPPPGPKFTGEMGERYQANIARGMSPEAAQQEAAKGYLKHADAVSTGASQRIVLEGLSIQDKKQEQTNEAFVKTAAEDPKLLDQRAAANPGLDIAAWNYIANDKLDVRGLGKFAKGDVDLIKARAGQIITQLGIAPGDLPAVRSQLKANSSALGRVTTQGAMVRQFENTLDRNLTVAEKLDAAYKRHDIQFLNRIQNAFKTGKGDPEALQLAAQLHGVSREWAKIMAGSTGVAGVPITEAQDADKLMSVNMSNGQLHGLFNNVIRVDAKNRTLAIQDEQNALINQIRGVTKPGGGLPAQSPNPPGASVGTNPPAARAAGQTPGPPAQAKYQDTATNHKTGQKVGWDGTKWVPIQ